MAIASNATWTFDVLIVARRTDTHGNVGSWRVQGVIDNNADTVTLPTAITKTLIFRTAWLTAAVHAHLDRQQTPSLLLGV